MTIQITPLILQRIIGRFRRWLIRNQKPTQHAVTQIRKEEKKFEEWIKSFRHFWNILELLCDHAHWIECNALEKMKINMWVCTYWNLRVATLGTENGHNKFLTSHDYDLLQAARSNWSKNTFTLCLPVSFCIRTMCQLNQKLSYVKIFFPAAVYLKLLSSLQSVKFVSNL